MSGVDANDPFEGEELRGRPSPDEEDAARRAQVRSPDDPQDPQDPDAPARGVDETDDPIPEPDEPA